MSVAERIEATRFEAERIIAAVIANLGARKSVGGPL